MQASDQGTMYMHAAKMGDLKARRTLDPTMEFHPVEENDQYVLKEICDYLGDHLGLRLVNIVPLSGNRMFVVEQSESGHHYSADVWCRVIHFDSHDPDGRWLVVRELQHLTPGKVSLTARRERTAEGVQKAGQKVTFSSGSLEYPEALDDMQTMLRAAENSCTYINSGEYADSVKIANSIKNALREAQDESSN